MLRFLQNANGSLIISARLFQLITVEGANEIERELVLQLTQFILQELLKRAEIFDGKRSKEAQSGIFYEAGTVYNLCNKTQVIQCQQRDLVQLHLCCGSNLKKQSELHGSESLN